MSAATGPGLGRLRSPTAVQATIYTGSSVIVGVLAVVSTALLARHMSITSYGGYAFANGLVLFAALIFDFGLFLPSGRLVALTEGGEQRRMTAAALALFLPLGLAFVVVIAVIAIAAGGAFPADARGPLLAVAPLAFVYPLLALLGYLARGQNRLHLYSACTVIAQGFIVVFVIVAAAALTRISPTLALVLRASGFVVAELILIVLLRPWFAHLAPLARRITDGVRRYGARVFVGSVLSIATYRMDVLMLGTLADARSVALYTLAGSVAAAIGLPALGIAGALFPRMTRERRLQAQWVTGVAGLALISAALVSLLAPVLIPLVFSSRYRGASGLVLPLALAEAVRAVTAIYNAFLAAQGRGRELQRAGIILAGSNVILNFALIPAFAAPGAAWASVIALVLNLAAHVFFYRRVVRGVGGSVIDSPSIQ